LAGLHSRMRANRKALMAHPENPTDTLVHVLKEKLGGEWKVEDNKIIGSGRFRFRPFRIEILYKNNGSNLAVQPSSTGVGHGWMGWVLGIIAGSQFIVFPILGFLMLGVLGALIGGLLPFFWVWLIGASRSKEVENLEMILNRILSELNFHNS